MKLLFVVHAFPPHHRAGVENYAAQIAQGLAETHQVVVATTRKVISLPTGMIRRDSLDGVPVFEVINNLDHDGFPGTFANATMERAFAAIVDEVRPDIVHFQHLMYWSLNLPAMARSFGVPCLMTLHDFHLACPRMGQMLDWEGRLCEAPSPARANPCQVRTWWAQDEGQRRWIRRLSAVRRATGLALDAPLRAADRIRRKLAPTGSSTGQARPPTD
ncbi:MAG: glycosyltransferase, partial [Salinibacterium sp.]|nr:glycosyltransferase [Salinibacterium sp.]